MLIFKKHPTQLSLYIVKVASLFYHSSFLDPSIFPRVTPAFAIPSSPSLSAFFPFFRPQGGMEFQTGAAICISDCFLHFSETKRPQCQALSLRGNFITLNVPWLSCIAHAL